MACIKKKQDLHIRENWWAASTMGWGYLLDGGRYMLAWIK